MPLPVLSLDEYIRTMKSYFFTGPLSIGKNVPLPTDAKNLPCYL